MKESHKRNRNPAYKKKYRVANWKEYGCFIHQVLLEVRLVLEPADSSLCLETECVTRHV
jgi:hypothetical protein